MDKETLLQLLNAIKDSIEHDDSFNGIFEYSQFPDGTFNVRAFIRTGNSQGSGSVQTYNEWDDIKTPYPFIPAHLGLAHLISIKNNPDGIIE